MSIADVARYLQDNLGQKLTAFLAGVGDAKQVGRWAAGAHVPRPDAEKRLRAALHVFQFVAQAESPHTVRAWFIGMNPQLDDLSPAADAIAEDKLRETLLAARAYVAGG